MSQDGGAKQPLLRQPHATFCARLAQDSFSRPASSTWQSADCYTKAASFSLNVHHCIYLEAPWPLSIAISILQESKASVSVSDALSYCTGSPQSHQQPGLRSSSVAHVSTFSTPFLLILRPNYRKSHNPSDTARLWELGKYLYVDLPLPS